MKFGIEYTDKTEDRLLIYRTNESSFDTEPTVRWINYDIVINKLNLTVVDEDNKIVQVWGFCPYRAWLKSNFSNPEYSKGILKVMDDLEPGFSYRHTDDEWRIFVNIHTGWVCLGDPEKTGKGIEFVNNCVAIIDNNDELVSLWLKPTYLPEINWERPD